MKRERARARAADAEISDELSLLGRGAGVSLSEREL